MAPTSLSTLTNPLITATQLLTFKTNSTETTPAQNFTQSLLTNSAGILLRLPQETIGTALILLQRYQVTSTSLPGKFPAPTVSAAVVYLTAKLSFTPVSPRSVINVYAYLTSNASPLWFINDSSPDADPDAAAAAYYVSEGRYLQSRSRLFTAETHVLAALGFNTAVVLPHTLALTYLHALGAQSVRLAERVLEHVNGALVSPQFVCLTHQPNAVAVAAIYLASREVGVGLVRENWWEVFDVEREDLGFLVLALGSLTGFARDLRESWSEHASRGVFDSLGPGVL